VTSKVRIGHIKVWLPVKTNTNTAL